MITLFKTTKPNVLPIGNVQNKKKIIKVMLKHVILNCLKASIVWHGDEFPPEIVKVISIVASLILIRCF